MRSVLTIICLVATMLGAPAVAQQACPILVVATNDDSVNGDTSSPCALIANPGPDGISLREALLAANNATGSGTITVTFASALAGATIALTERFAPITRDQITLTGLTSSGQPAITVDASPSAGAGCTLFVAASQFSMSGLRFTFTPANCGVIQIGGAGYSLSGQLINAPAQISDFQINGNTFSTANPGNSSSAIFITTTFNMTSGATISDAVISNNTFSGQFEAINIGTAGTGNVIENITVSNNSFSQMTSSGTSAVEVSAEQTNNAVYGVQIVQNTFTNNLQGAVIDINGASSGNSIQNTLIARNVFSGNLQALGAAAGVDSNSANNLIANTQIVDNLIELTGFNGQGSATIQVVDSQSGGTNNKVTGVSFVNNTINNGNSSDPPGWGMWITSSGGVTGVSIWNTIFWGLETSPPLSGIASPGQVSYSIIDQAGFSGVNHNINADPLFVNPSQGDFHLQSGSPARGAGITAGAPALDLDCQPRGSPPSIGAYEFGGPNICPSTYSAPLTATPTSGTPPLVVAFTASGLALPMTYTINFGDGTTGALTQSSCIGLAAIVGGQGGIQCSGSASHTYTAAGGYTATLLNALGLTVGTVAITVSGAAPNVSNAPPHKAATVGSQTILGSQTLGPQTLGSQTIPALQNAMQDVPRLTVEAPFAGSHASVPTISSFTASPASISPFAGDGSATLSWSVASATSLTISGLGTVTGDSIQVSPSQTTAYTLTANNAQGAATAQTTVTVAGYRSRRADPLSR
jgi:PKD repeat protein